MSYLAEEIERQMKVKGVNTVALAQISGISASQLYKWANLVQTSITEEQLRALAPALSDDIADHAALVRAHLLDEKYGPGSELVRVEIDHPAALQDRPKVQAKGERAIQFLAQERLSNRDLNDLLLDLARVLGAEL